MRYIFLCFVCVILFSGCSENINRILKSKDINYKLRKADSLFAKQRYFSAYQIYENIVPYFRGEKQHERIFYNYAMSAYYNEDYTNAGYLFKKFIENFPLSEQADDVDFFKAMSYYKQSPKVELDQEQTFKAIGSLQSFIVAHPKSDRIAKAREIIDLCKSKLEEKDYKSAMLYYNLEDYRASGVVFQNLLENYPDSYHLDEYAYKMIKSNYLYALKSVYDKQEERFTQAENQCNDFLGRFSDSKYINDVKHYLSLCKEQLKKNYHE